MSSHHQHDGPTFVAGTPRQVAVVGAGMVGLATAWFLQEAGVQVTVYERDHVGAGASWGNAGWLTPALTAPLPEPAVLRYGLRAVLSPRSPVYLPLRADRTLLRFLTGFVAPQHRAAVAARDGRVRAAQRAGPRGLRRPRRRRDARGDAPGPAVPGLLPPGARRRGAARRAGADPRRRAAGRLPPGDRLAGARDGAGAVATGWVPPCRSTASATCTRRSSSGAWPSRCATAAVRWSRASTSPTCATSGAASPWSPRTGSVSCTTPS